MDNYPDIPTDEIQDARQIQQREDVINALVAGMRAMHDLLRSEMSSQDMMYAAKLIANLCQQYFAMLT